MKLSEQLRKWRAERPDEWTMDRFIALAEHLESEAKKIECEAILKAVRATQTQERIDDDMRFVIRPSKLEAYARGLLE
jgi:serine phosphatase RsbU (regulator of sigma subunit)